MRRDWVFYDVGVIRAEMDALPSKDATKLTALMDHYRLAGLGNPSPAQIDDYGDGLYRLRHVKSAYQGRLIFFAVDRSAGFERLVVLTAYKKESQNVPHQVIARARQRMAEYQKRRK